MSRYNRKYYEQLARSCSDNEHDIDFICNRFASAYQKIDEPCSDNFRACKVNDDGDATMSYLLQRNKGCCGFYDVKITNELTGHSFYIGFNYGH